MLQKGMLSFALLGADWVLWLLVGLSVLCLTISIERAFFLVRDGTDRTRLRSAFQGFERGGALDTLRDALAPLTGFEARVLIAGLEAIPYGAEGAERAIASTLQAERLRMDRGLAVLATVGSNAPFLGLFGTVLGIIRSFHDLALNTSQASETVMAGISEALVATAVGLMVAIPAVVLFNAFSRTNTARLARAESLANLVLSRIGHG